MVTGLHVVQFRDNVFKFSKRCQGMRFEVTCPIFFLNCSPLSPITITFSFGLHCTYCEWLFVFAVI